MKKINKKQQVNVWKTTTLILGAVCIALFIGWQYNNQPEEKINLNGVEITKAQFCVFYDAEVLNVDSQFNICNMKNNKCSGILKLQQDICSK